MRRLARATTSSHGGVVAYLDTLIAGNTPLVSTFIGLQRRETYLEYRTTAENDRTHPFSTLDPTADAFNW